MTNSGFIPLRTLQRNLPLVRETLQNEKGRVVLTNNGQPTYLLVDLSGRNVISMINWLDEYADVVTTNHRQVSAVKKFIDDIAQIKDEDDVLTTADFAELASLRSQTNSSLKRTVDL